MKRITLILGVVAVMVAMLVALAAPAMAQDEGNLFVPPIPPVVQQVVPPAQPVINQPVDTTFVQPGDTLWGMAQEQLGPDASPELINNEVGTIHDLNRDIIGDNPHMIHPGQELRLPSHR